MEAISVEHSIWIYAPRERVWDAITDDEQIRVWWGGDYWEISELKVGGEIKFGEPDDLMVATIGTLDPPREFVIQWPPQEQYHSISMSTRYILEDENGGTRVTVSETGYEALPDDIRQKRLDSTAKGYRTVMEGLKAFIEGSTP